MRVVMKLTRYWLVIFIIIPAIIDAKDSFVFGATHSLQDFLHDYKSPWVYEDYEDDEIDIVDDIDDELMEVQYSDFEYVIDELDIDDDMSLAFPPLAKDAEYGDPYMLGDMEEPEAVHDLLAYEDEEVQPQLLYNEYYGQGARMMPQGLTLQAQVTWLINDGVPDSLYKADKLINKLNRSDRYQYRRMLTNRKRILAGKDPIRVRIPGEIIRFSLF